MIKYILLFYYIKSKKTNLISVFPFYDNSHTLVHFQIKAKQTLPKTSQNFYSLDFSCQYIIFMIWSEYKVLYTHHIYFKDTNFILFIFLDTKIVKFSEYQKIRNLLKIPILYTISMIWFDIYILYHILIPFTKILIELISVEFILSFISVSQIKIYLRNIC